MDMFYVIINNDGRQLSIAIAAPSSPLRQDPHCFTLFSNNFCVMVTAAAVMYERASRCELERGGAAWRRRWLAAAVTCLRLAAPDHAFLAKPTGPASAPRPVQVIHHTSMIHANIVADVGLLVGPVFEKRIHL